MSSVSAGGPGLGASLLRLLLLVVLVLAGLLLAASWYFADVLTSPTEVRPFAPDTVVRGATDDTITLDRTADLATGGSFGLQLPNDGYAALGDAVEIGDETVTYTVASYAERVPEPGTVGRVDEYWRVGTPADVGLGYRDVTVSGALGDMAAWWVEGGEQGTVVYVHGWGATREEGLKFLDAITAAGWDVLVPTYRGDLGAPPLRDGRLRFGLEEWVDVDAALGFVAQREGSDRPVVLFGSSYGGAVVAQTLDRSPWADDVDGVVLDSPVLSMDALLDLQANLNGVPEFVEPVLLPTTQLVAGLLYGLDTAALEQVADDGTFDVPTLVFHGARDDFVPWEPSLALAGTVDAVEHVPFEGARHLRSWNVDPARYEQLVTAFLTDLS